MGVSKDEYRRTIGMFATGVAVITTAVEGRFKGMTANALSSVSLDPVLLLVCVHKLAHTHPILRQSGAFAVNVLASDQEQLSRLFAKGEGSDAADLFGVPYRLGKLGAPILDGVLAYLECRVTEIHPGGDHDIFIGEVEDMGTPRSDGEPLLFFRGGYGLFAPMSERVRPGDDVRR